MDWIGLDSSSFDSKSYTLRTYEDFNLFSESNFHKTRSI